MAEKTPNHICRNPNCPNGINGEPKHYWACEDSDRYGAWRSMACSPQCYAAYITEVDRVRELALQKSADSIDAPKSNDSHKFVTEDCKTKAT